MIVSVVGARPQFVKAAVVSKALKEIQIEEEIIHTGQHYDYNMNDVFFQELGLPGVSKNLHIGSGHHGEQTGAILAGIEAYLLGKAKVIKGLLVYGDTNSTLAGALAASKMHIPVIHVEAGLRSFNKKMPEEINRIVTDHISDILFCSSQVGVNQLRKEGIEKQVHDVGDVMYDAVSTFSSVAEKKVDLSKLLPFKNQPFALVTIHRPDNTDNPTHLKSIIDALGELDIPCLWPVHPRNDKKLQSLTLPDNLFTIPPVSYFEMLQVLSTCEIVLTDSGGLQKEAYWKQKQCVTLREQTEWVETLEGGWNTLTGSDKSKILQACHKKPTSSWKTLYGDAKAANKIANIVKAAFYSAQ